MGRFVSINATGTNSIISTTGGKTWVAGGNIPGSFTTMSICYGAGKFVAVSSNSTPVIYSLNGGVTWLQGNGLGSAYYVGIAYGNGIFVAISGAGSQQGAVSQDGINWQGTDLAWWGYWTSCAFGNGVFSAVSVNGSGIMYSRDGVLWQFGTGGSDASNIVFGGGKFVAINGSSNPIYSLDGINWSTGGPMPTSDNYMSLTYGNGMFVSTAYDSSACATSVDGINWQVGPALPQVDYWDTVFYGQGVFVTLPQNNQNQAAYSNTLSPTAGYLCNNSNLLTVAVDGTGNSGIWKSANNGTTFSQTNVTTGNFSSDSYQ